MRLTTTTINNRPAAVPVDLDAGRLTVAESVKLAAMVLAAVAIAAVASIIAYFAWPAYTVTWLDRLRVIVTVWAGATAIVTVWYAVIVVRIMVDDWRSYQVRLADWHEVALEAYQARQGLDQQVTYTELDLLPSRLPDMLALVVWIHRQVQSGVDSPWAIRQLQAGPLLLSGHSLGTVATRHDAEMVARYLVRCGLIADRAPGRAGRWVAQSESEAIDAIIRYWRQRES
ncbi:hypothetical protein NW811_11845 [Synechococcus sp. R60.4]|jgi:hypothetical protein|uniref:hypothetical protein n=1 Tax=Synechococcus sp. R60.4 TaxID=2964520 RepID=UPI0039C35B27